MASIDLSSGNGPRVKEQLEQEMVVWMTTISASGTPQPNLVWFLWEADSDSVLVYTQPNAVRLKNLERNNRVSLNFNSDTTGSEMSVLTGTAAIDESAPRAVDHPAYLAKYNDGIKGLGSTPESFSTAYSVAIRIIPEKIRGF